MHGNRKDNNNPLFSNNGNGSSIFLVHKAAADA